MTHAERPAVVEHRDFLNEAQRVLCDGSLGSRERLDKAAMLFWQAYVHRGGHWSVDSQRRADAILLRLMGPTKRIKKTVASIDDAAVDELCRAISEFIESDENL